MKLFAFRTHEKGDVVDDGEVSAEPFVAEDRRTRSGGEGPSRKTRAKGRLPDFAQY